MAFPLTGWEILALAGCAGIGVVAFLHLIAISVRNEVFVHQRRVEVNTLLDRYQRQIADLYGMPIEDEVIEVDVVEDEPASAATGAQPGSQSDARSSGDAEPDSEVQSDGQAESSSSQAAAPRAPARAA